MFAFKVLSRFCGGYEISSNAEKVVLVEKQFALRIFGQGPRCQALRSSYYLAYSAGAIAAGIHDPDTLTTYGKRDLLRSKKGRSIQEGSRQRIELQKKKKMKKCLGCKNTHKSPRTREIVNARLKLERE